MNTSLDLQLTTFTDAEIKSILALPTFDIHFPFGIDSNSNTPSDDFSTFNMDTSSILFDPMEVATATEWHRALPPAPSEWPLTLPPIPTLSPLAPMSKALEAPSSPI
ncbi:hypothetical protein MVEN_01626400 [Mycena venus]|uniref:Uncharacterized protein n=1 Tax=Mycena venus TaxID=2733690 RepID=A0A8H6XQH6_9AGAR|nr:hypothetical protein MVEN_01626400 [Mycena venus]